MYLIISLFFNRFILKIFVFDTETTWFINKKESSLDMQPHIIQFAWIMWDLENWKFREEKRVDIYINPWISIPYASSLVHHIYDVDVKNKSLIEDNIEQILFYINTPDLIIWHNIEFDEDMLKLELKRLWREYDYNPKQTLCTMKNTVNFCAIKWNWERLKYPKLWELHKVLFWEYFSWAHNAIVDVENTMKCFLELVKKDVLKVEEKKEVVMSLF